MMKLSTHGADILDVVRSISSLDGDPLRHVAGVGAVDVHGQLPGDERGRVREGKFTEDPSLYQPT